MTKPVVTEADIQRVLLFIYARNYCEPEAWIDLNQVGIGANLEVVLQATHVVKILESQRWIEIQRGEPWKVRLAPAGELEVIRLKTPLWRRWTKDRAAVVAVTVGVITTIITSVIREIFSWLVR